VLRIVNFGPDLSDLVSHNIVTHMPVTSEVLEFYSTKHGINDWAHFSNLEEVVRRGATVNTQLNNSNNSNSASRNNSDSDNIHAELLRSFSPQSSSPQQQGQPGQQQPDNSRASEFANIFRVMQVARSLGIADLTPLGRAVAIAARSMEPGNVNDPLAMMMMNSTSSSPNNSFADTMSMRSTSRPTRSDFSLERMKPGQSKKELQFHAMLLTPHQIELIFVLCTLLSGRRKLAMQKKLVSLEFGDILTRMYSRMSWDAPPYEGPNQMEHIHGPNCECNPEGAVRIQFLRLVHNFFDRDFLGNNNKLVTLSSAEKLFIARPVRRPDIGEEGEEGGGGGGGGERVGNVVGSAAEQQDWRDDQSSLSSADLQRWSGLISRIIVTLQREKADSTYRFWLSACVENFLRGGGRRAQNLVARVGALAPTVHHIIHCRNNHSTLQTSFDLLGEVVKGNRSMLEQLESDLSTDDFRELMIVIMDNLVESNVFLRSLFLTLEIISCTDQSEQKSSNSSPAFTSDSFGFVRNSIVEQENVFLNLTGESQSRRFGYLYDSWVQFSPLPLVDSVVQQFNPRSEWRQKMDSKGRSSTNSSNVPVGSVGVEAEVGTASQQSASAGNVLFENIRRATSQLLRFTGGGSGSDIDSGNGNDGSGFLIQTPEGIKAKSTTGSPIKGPIWDDNEVCVTATMVDDCDSAVPQSAGRKDLRSSSLLSSLSSSLCEAETYQTVPFVISQPDQSSSRFLSTNSPTIASPFAIPTSLFRFSMFILQEKTSMLVRLMSIVSLRNINHENICCLNTALLILLFDYVRYVCVFII
jgi:hypothetical protein